MWVIKENIVLKKLVRKSLFIPRSTITPGLPWITLVITVRTCVDLLLAQSVKTAGTFNICSLNVCLVWTSET